MQPGKKVLSRPFPGEELDTVLLPKINNHRVPSSHRYLSVDLNEINNLQGNFFQQPVHRQKIKDKTDPFGLSLAEICGYYLQTLNKPRMLWVVHNYFLILHTWGMLISALPIRPLF